MSELTAEADGVKSETVETENSETVTETEGKQETSPEDLQKIIAEKAFNERQSRREADEAKAELAQLKTEQAASTQGEKPDIPELPDDKWADDYDQKVVEREAALRQAAEFDATTKVQEQLQEQIQQQTLQTQAKQQAEAQAQYEARGVQHGLTEQEMGIQANRVGTYGLTPGEVEFVMSDVNGPLIVKYLSENPVEAEKFASLPATAIRLVHLATDVSKKASDALTIKITETPDPLLETRGGGIGTKKGGLLEGARFE
jgi:hypothetical protein